jgi:Acetyltransferase (GNAT) family.
MLYSFIIRCAAESDAEAIHGILQQAFREYADIIGNYNLDALRETVEDVRCAIAEKTVLVALVDNEAVGTLRLDIRGDRAYLSRFAVCNGNRRNGIGEALMNAAERYLISKGVRVVTLHTASRHASLMRFYYGLGFFVEAVETDRGYLRARLVKELSRDNTQ